MSENLQIKKKERKKRIGLVLIWGWGQGQSGGEMRRGRMGIVHLEAGGWPPGIWGFGIKGGWISGIDMLLFPV